MLAGQPPQETCPLADDWDRSEPRRRTRRWYQQRSRFAVQNPVMVGPGEAVVRAFHRQLGHHPAKFVQFSPPQGILGRRRRLCAGRIFDAPDERAFRWVSPTVPTAEIRRCQRSRQYRRAYDYYTTSFPPLPDVPQIKSSGDCRRCRLRLQSLQMPLMINRWPVTRKLCSLATASRMSCSPSLLNSISLSHIWQ
jgi:hypothetical protein